VQTPYVLFPGINAVSADDFAGEMGPIEHYANAKSITGRAGQRPSRYQSDQVDKANGPLVRNGNRALRAAIPGIADNLIHCNHHFQHLATLWASQGKDARHADVRIGLRFCRLAFQMVAGRQVFRHLCIHGRHYILDKLTAFHRDHQTPMPELLRDLQAAIGHVPEREHAAEAQPLHEELRRIQVPWVGWSTAHRRPGVTDRSAQRTPACTFRSMCPTPASDPAQNGRSRERGASFR
jgi:hypothetical protein